MNLKEYIEATRRTWNYQDPEKDLEHAALGIVSEVGELLNAYKKNVGYGKELDLINIKEELGDIHFFIARIIDQLSIEDEVSKWEVNYHLTPFNQPNTLLCDFSLTAGELHVKLLSKNKEINRVIYYMLDNIYNLASYYGWTKEEIRKSNIAKLYARFPEKFSQDQALIRNLENEIKALENGKKF